MGHYISKYSPLKFASCCQRLCNRHSTRCASSLIKCDSLYTDQPTHPQMSKESHSPSRIPSHSQLRRETITWQSKEDRPESKPTAAIQLVHFEGCKQKDNDPPIRVGAFAKEQIWNMDSAAQRSLSHHTILSNILANSLKCLEIHGRQPLGVGNLYEMQWNNWEIHCTRLIHDRERVSSV